MGPMSKLAARPAYSGAAAAAAAAGPPASATQGGSARNARSCARSVKRVSSACVQGPPCALLAPAPPLTPPAEARETHVCKRADNRCHGLR